MLLRSIDFGCVKEAVTAVAMLSTDNIFLQPHREDDKQLAAMAHKRFATKDGDLPTLVSIYDNWQKANRDKNWSRNQYLSQRSLQHAAEVSKQLAGLLSSMNIDPLISCQNEKPKFLKCVAAGLFLNVAQRTSTSVFVKGGRNLESSLRNKDTDAPYKTLVGGAAVHVHPSSVMFSIAGGERKLPEFVCYAELLVTSKQYMRCITAIEEKWLVEIAPNFYKNKAST
jgi:ATP-dependent RNA helicase DHX8/PRP22